MSTTKVVIVYHSGQGHTARQAAAVREGASTIEGVEAVLIPSSTPEPWSILAAADAIIFGAPTYMGSASAGFKAFMDASVKVWLTGAWRDKIAAGFTNSSGPSGDKLATLTELARFAAQHGMLWIGIEVKTGAEGLNRLGGWLGAMAQSPYGQPAELAPPPADLDTARHLGRRVAAAAARWRGLPCRS